MPDNTAETVSDGKADAGGERAIHIEGARQHNLKNLTLDIPRDKLVVICGPSGSGKSTLAFDLIYAEGQRRYVESLSAYARQFLPQMDKPDVDKIEGLSPAISMEQQASTRNPRSTVGTVTEIYDFLRVFFARLGTMYCPSCGRRIAAQSIDEIIGDILTLDEGTRFLVLAPLTRMQKGTQQDRFKKLRTRGFARVRINGVVYALDDVPALDKNKKYDIDLVVDRLVMREGIRGRLAESAELALSCGDGDMSILLPGGEDGSDTVTLYSTSSVCPECRLSLPKASPQLFSFNGPQGACPRCLGLGTVEYFDPALIAPNRGLSIDGGALLPLRSSRAAGRQKAELQAFAGRFNTTTSTPLSEYSPEALSALFFGESEPGKSAEDAGSALRRNWLGGSVRIRGKDKGAERAGLWPGVVSLLEKGMQYGDAWRDELSRYRRTTDCPECGGARLNDAACAVRVDDLSIVDFCRLSIARALDWMASRTFGGRQAPVAEPLLKELQHRLRFLVRVGLDYLALGRAMSTLSGGEAQRIRLASQLGSGLVGVTYVLDEPSIGLHPRDNARLLRTLRDLQRRGNTVLVVEHDEATIREADTVLELGPGSGEQGGELVFRGTVPQLLRDTRSLTAKYLRGDLAAPRPQQRRKPKSELVLRQIRTNNLLNVDCRIPLGVFTCVTGVSGSGKSSLVVDTLYKHLALARGIKVENPGTIGGIEGIDAIERIIAIDQSPIGRTPRSNPATYTKVFDEIRTIFASSPDAKKHGYNPGRFSFNVKGGRCEACGGDGQIRIEMHFLPDVFVQCDVCGGKRYNHETLEVRYKDLNIAEVLDLTVQQARAFFGNYPILERRLSLLEEVGLDYLRLGQPAPTLSGGEAQRVKISRELGKRSLPGTMYILDEPTTGLHMHEVGKLICVLHGLVERGATVVVIEHNADMIAGADYVIDLGPGGGENGGRVIACGTPEELLCDPNSVTGAFLGKKQRVSAEGIVPSDVEKIS
ncbi:MAG: excinuclease ABC subunit UvrA [Desulfovibrio sp.]|jgi:excinuclease ABC subunit A|nr:excinuclease ABC subunit UvrA [Desulfovibrio sp.]